MRLLFVCVLTAAFAAAGTDQARPEILITVDKSAQRMTVNRDGQPLYTWPVSTGRSGYPTPSGSYTAFRMEADHYSVEWDDAPMPHSIFFTKIGHAIHGTYDTKNLGKPASHGCVRLSPENAETLFSLVQQEGAIKTKVVLTGSEQVALARRGGDMPRVRNNGYGSPPPRSFNSDVNYPRQDNFEPGYGNRSYGYGRPQYVQPQYVQPQYGPPGYRYPPGYYGAD